MPTTSNFGWTTPADTDLVKDGAAAIRTLGNGIDTSFLDLKGGTTDQVLAKNSGTDLDFKWVAQDDSNAIQNAIVDAKGDLISATAADTPARLASSGVNGDVLTVATGEATGLKWAAPSGALNWTERQAAVGGAFSAIAYNGSNLYVAVALNGKLYTSTDAKTWTSRTSGFGANDIRGIAYGAAIWVAVGANGTITSSTDGITWTARTSGVSTNGLNAVVFANSLFVAVGSGANGGTGGITTSSDGITWTKRTTPTTSSTTLYGIAYGGGEWVAVGGINTRAGYYSSDAITWTVSPASLSITGFGVFYENSLFNVFGSGSVATGATGSGTYTTRTGFSMPNSNTSSSSVAYAVGVYDSKFWTTPSLLSILVRQPIALNSANQGQAPNRVDLLGNYYTGGTAQLDAYAVYVSDVGIILGMQNGQIVTSF
jgi:hypothetical protein